MSDNVEILLQFKQSEDLIKGIKKSAEQIDKRMKKTTDKAGSNFKKMAKIAAAAFAGIGIKNFAKESIEAFKAQDMVEIKLRANMKTVTAYRGNIELMNVAFERMRNIASDIQKEGIIGDEVLLSAASQLSTFQLSEKSISRLMPKMADMLANQKGYNVTQEDAFGLANKLGKAITSGELSALAESGIQLDENTKKRFKLLNGSQRVVEMEKILKANVGNVNKEMAKTPLGKMKQLADLWGDMKENIGKAIVPSLSKFGELIKSNLPNIENMFVSLTESLMSVFESLMPVVQPLLDLVLKIAKSLQPLFEKLGPVIENLIPPIMKVLDVAIEIVTALLPLLDILEPVLDIVSALGEALTPIIPIALDILKPFTALIDVFAKIFSFVLDIAKTLGSGIFKTISNLIDGKSIKDSIQEGFKGAGGEVAVKYNALGEKIADSKGGKYFKDVATKIKDSSAGELAGSKQSYDTFLNTPMPKSTVGPIEGVNNTSSVTSNYNLKIEVPDNLSASYKNDINKGIAFATAKENERKARQHGVVL